MAAKAGEPVKNTKRVPSKLDFVNRLHDDRLSGNFGKGAGSQFFVEKADFAHGETALVDPLPQIFTAKRRGSGDGYAQ